MPSHKFKTKSFQKLFKKWNLILKEDGFKDVEDFSPPEPLLIHWDSFRFQRGGRLRWNQEFGEAYYSLASALLTDGFKFGSDFARRVWELHCQGRTIRAIERILYWQLIGYKGCKRDCIHTIILKVQAVSGIRTR
jgi:hypothetical protein